MQSSTFESRTWVLLSSRQVRDVSKHDVLQWYGCSFSTLRSIDCFSLIAWQHGTSLNISKQVNLHHRLFYFSCFLSNSPSCYSRRLQLTARSDRRRFCLSKSIEIKYYSAKASVQQSKKINSVDLFVLLRQIDLVEEIEQTLFPFKDEDIREIDFIDMRFMWIVRII